MRRVQDRSVGLDAWSLLHDLWQRPVVARALRVLGWVRDLFPWTPLGVLLSLLGVLGLTHFAYDEIDLVWLVFGYALLALLLLAPALVIPAAIYLRWGPLRRQDQAVTVEAGPGAAAGRLVLDTEQARSTAFSLPRLSLLPLLQISWRFVDPEADVQVETRAGRLHERVTVARRCEREHVERAIGVADVFGVCRIWLRHRGATPLTVLPALQGLSKIGTLTSFASGDDLPHPRGLSEGDRLDLRRYQAGDPVRFIHWKVLARTRNLVVRVPETALSEANRVAAFMVAGRDDQATAALARLALTRGFLGSDFVFATGERPAGVTTVALSLSLLARSGAPAFAAQGAAAVPTFLTHVDHGAPASLLFFAPPSPGPWLAQLIHALRGREARVLIAVDGLRDEQAGAVARLRRLVLAPEPPRTHPRAELAEVVRRLTAAQLGVAVYDRKAGRLLNASQVMGRRSGRPREHAA